MNLVRMSMTPPKADPVHIEVNDRGSEKCKRLAQNESAHDRYAQRPAKLGARSRPKRERHRSEESRHGGHHNGPESKHAGLKNRIA